MPDSKLVEKLGFTLVSSEKYPGLYDIVKDGYENQGATTEEIALWNLCLELSERLEQEQVHLYEFHHCNCERKDA